MATIAQITEAVEEFAVYRAELAVKQGDSRSGAQLAKNIAFESFFEGSGLTATNAAYREVSEAFAAAFDRELEIPAAV